jgi:hypothetical protein
MAVLVWLCTLPIVGLVVGHVLGRSAAGIAALATLGLVSAACWLICTRRFSTHGPVAHERHGPTHTMTLGGRFR